MPVYRDEKTKKYYAKFYYKDWRGQRHQKLKRGFSRSQEAKKYERDFLNELTQGSLITFEHLCQHYLSDNEGRLKPTTQYTSKNIIRNWLLPVFGYAHQPDYTAYDPQMADRTNAAQQPGADLSTLD